MSQLEKTRADFAWRKTEGCSKEYRNLAKGLPALIMSNGLIQTLGFLKAKGKHHHAQAAEHIEDWLQQALNQSGGIPQLIGLEPAAYRRATEEVVAILRWLRHFADVRHSND